MTIALLDDEPYVIEQISEILISLTQAFQDTVEIKKYYRPELFLEDLEILHFDIVFLDIYMPQMTGLDVAREIRNTHTDTLVILLTNSENKNDFALACQLCTFRILFKPINIDHIRTAWEEAYAFYHEKQSQYLLVTTGSTCFKVPYKDIYLIESHRRKLTVYTKIRKYSYYQKFNEVASKLTKFGFYCIYKGTLINLEYVTGLNRNDRMVLMSIGDPIPISRDKLQDFTNNFMQYSDR